MLFWRWPHIQPFVNKTILEWAFPFGHTFGHFLIKKKLKDKKKNPKWALVTTQKIKKWIISKSDFKEVKKLCFFIKIMMLSLNEQNFFHNLNKNDYKNDYANLFSILAHTTFSKDE